MDNVIENDGQLSNVGPLTRTVLEGEIKKFGKAFGQGQNSRPAMALRLIEAANRLDDVRPDDAEDLYTKFQTAASAAKGHEYSVESSFKVQVSKVRQFITLGQLQEIDPVGLMDDCTDVIDELSALQENPLKGSAYDRMLDIARRQIKRPDIQFTKDEMRAIFTEQKADKTELQKVTELYKRTYKLRDEMAEAGSDVSYMDEAVTQLGNQIMTLDGELPPMTKEAKKTHAALQTLKQYGVIA